MTCCVKIRPITVTQQTDFYGSVNRPVLASYRQSVGRWSPVWSETLYRYPQNFDGSPGAQIYWNDWDEAFTAMDYQPLVAYPESLKHECYELSHCCNSESFTFRVETVDSPFCGPGASGHNFFSYVFIRLELQVCSPVTVKAKIEANVESQGLPREGGGFTHPYSWYDLAEVFVSHPVIGPDSLLCGEPDHTTSYDGWERIAAVHARQEGGGECDKRRIVHCGSTILCEGRRYIDIQMGSHDHLANKDQYFEVTLTFGCQQPSTLNCSTEQDDPDYTNPTDTPGPFPPGNPPENPGGPTPPPGSACNCGCLFDSVTVTMEGFENGRCEYLAQVGGYLFEMFGGSNLNRTFTAFWDEDEGKYVFLAGVEKDPNNPGILYALYFDGMTSQIFRAHIWKIEVVLFCSSSASGLVRFEPWVLFTAQCVTQQRVSPPYMLPSCQSESFPISNFFPCIDFNTGSSDIDTDRPFRPCNDAYAIARSTTVPKLISVVDDGTGGVVCDCVDALNEDGSLKTLVFHVRPHSIGEC